MLPIGMEITIQTGAAESSMFLALSAILSGAVYGDHTSPISDTTILSAVGAGCSVQSHFITQFPYATISAVCAAISFVVVSYFQSTILAFSMGLLLLIGVFYMLKIRYEGDLVKDKNLNENMQRF